MDNINDPKENKVSEDDIARIAVDEDFLMEGDSSDMSSHMQHWAYIALALGIVFGFLYIKRGSVMSLEDSRMSLVAAIVLILFSVFFLIADKRRNRKSK